SRRRWIPRNKAFVLGSIVSSWFSSALRSPGALTQELRTTPLHSARIPSGTLGIRLVAIFFCDFAIHLRVIVHNHTDQTELLRPLHLQATENAAILDNRNLAFKI